MSLLDKISSPEDIRRLKPEQLAELTEEIRHEIISIVAQNGGHLASNLGAVELTLALHICLDVPTDQIIWDVGHQSYVHKMITGRVNKMKTIRKHKGLSGFPKRTESDADAFGTGHASTAISAALGLAAARDHLNKSHKIVAVVGDGALTGGLAYEGLNNAGASKRDLLVILNDNNMSISPNVGALSKHLTGIMADQRYNRLRNEIWELTGRFKRRDKIRAMVSHIEDSIKSFFVPGIFFDRLGFRYFGPIEGHDLPLLIKTINQIKELHGPILLHVVTTKGKGYAPAEADATKFHGVGAFDKVTGKTNAKSGLPAYTNVFGDTLVKLAEKDEKIIAITAAMTSGTGLAKFSERFPDRLYDVGIAEGHATCFAAGLAAGGMKPFVVIYSTFLQRAYDQIIHDAALQKLPVVFCIDRAGLVGEDGPTHHGTFDLSYLAAVPNLTLMVPKDGNELRSMMRLAAEADLGGPVAIRYPRSAIPTPVEKSIKKIECGVWEELSTGGDTVLIATGTMVEVARKTRELISDEIELSVINARFIKPLDFEKLDECRKKYSQIIVIEENSNINGLGAIIGSYLQQKDYNGSYKMLGIPDKFISHGSRSVLLKEIGLDEESVADYILASSAKPIKHAGKIEFRKGGYRKPVAVDIDRKRRTASGKK
jgi:1-deoxy-D-xylulose-5-phosphate synthase